MQPIRLPLKVFFDSDGSSHHEEEGQESVDLNEFVRMFVNQVFKELKEALSRFHSVSEISCRRDLSTFFRQKVADFECLFLLLSGVEYLEEVRVHHRRIKQIHWIGEEYVKTADRLAHLFESLKLSIMPKCDVLTSLQTIYDPSYLLPRLKSEITHEAINFEDVNRLNRIYLEKEDLSVYSDIVIEQGITTLLAHPFSFSLALCGEISKPEWKLINVKSSCEPFSKHLLFSMPHSIAAISEFLRGYGVYSRAKEVFQELKRASRYIDMEIKGYYKKFEVSIHTFRMVVHARYSGINAKIFMGENVFPAGDNLVETFEDKIVEFLRKEGRDAAFSFMDGFKVLANGNIQTFKNLIELDIFLDKQKENLTFYSFFEKRFTCYRNHGNVEFGEKNVFIARNGDFVCVKLLGLTETRIEVRVFVGCHEIADFLVYKEVFLETDGEGRIVGVMNRKHKTHTEFKTEDIYNYFEDCMELLLIAYRFVPLINGDIEVGTSILLTHLTDMGQIRLTIEKEKSIFIITAGKSRIRSEDLNVICGYVVFVLLLSEILVYSKTTSIFKIATMELYEKASLLFPKATLTLTFDTKVNVKTDSFVLEYILNSSPMQAAGIFDIICCFHNIFSAGLVPIVYSSSGLIFVFRHLFKGKIKLKLVDRVKFELVLDELTLKDVFSDTSSIVPSANLSFVKKLANLHFRERILLVADIARRSYEVSMGEGDVHVSTPCISFRVSVEDSRFVFCVDSVNSMSLDLELIRAVNRYFTRIITIGRNIPTSFGFLSNADEFNKLLKHLST